MWELLSVSLRCRLRNAASQAWAGPFKGSQGTRWPSLHRVCTFSPSGCPVMPRQCLPAYITRSSTVVSSSAVSSVCGPHSASTATQPTTLFAIELRGIPIFAVALLMVSSLFLTTSTACLALSYRQHSGATWVKVYMWELSDLYATLYLD